MTNKMAEMEILLVWLIAGQTAGENIIKLEDIKIKFIQHESKRKEKNHPPQKALNNLWENIEVIGYLKLLFQIQMRKNEAEIYLKKYG